MFKMLKISMGSLGASSYLVFGNTVFHMENALPSSLYNEPFLISQVLRCSCPALLVLVVSPGTGIVIQPAGYVVDGIVGAVVKKQENGKNPKLKMALMASFGCARNRSFKSFKTMTKQS